MTTILTEVNGFTPVIDAIVTDLGGTPALVFGMVWRFCQMESGTCTASVETIANRLNMDRKTAERHIKKLCAAGYLEDTTPNQRHAPHVYRDTGKAQVVGSMQGGTKRTTLSTEVRQKAPPVGQIAPPRSGEMHQLGGAKRTSKIPLKDTSEDREKDTSPPSAESTTKPPPKLHTPLEPDTWQARMMFAKLQANAKAKNRTGPKRFHTLEQKKRFDAAVVRLDGRFKEALERGLGNGCLSVKALVNYIASPKWQEPQRQQTRGSPPKEKELPLDVQVQRDEVRRRLRGGDG